MSIKKPMDICKCCMQRFTRFITCVTIISGGVLHAHKESTRHGGARTRAAQMAEKEFKRKLTAILHADVAGYSRLMEENETETLQTLNIYNDILNNCIKKHNGHVDRKTADSEIADFSSVLMQ